MAATLPVGPCLTDDDFAVALDGLAALPESERRAIEQHVDTCSDCRRHLSALSALEEPGPDKTAIESTSTCGKELVGRYRLERRLGSGASGIVWDAHDPELDRRVAVKQIRIADDPARAARAADEARFLAECPHPNIVQIFDVVHDAETISIVMELVEGVTLRGRVAEGPMGWRDVVEIASALAFGLVTAHSHELVHRDIKPSNILLGDDGRARLVDFGLAGRYVAPDSNERQPRMFVGTPGYASPEQLRGQPATELSDVFGLGVAMWEALTGRPAFPRGTFRQMLSAIERGPAPVTTPAPKRLVQVLRRAIDVDPQHRWQSVGAFRDALLEVRGRQRRPRWPVGAAAAGLIAVGALVARQAEPTPAPVVDATENADRPPLQPTDATRSLSAGQAFADAGEFAAALASGRATVALAREAGELRTELMAQLLIADAQQQLDQPHEALELAEEVEGRAEQARLDHIVAEARTLAVWIEANGTGRHERALELVESARAAIGRLEDADSLAQQLELARAVALVGVGRVEEAKLAYLGVAEVADRGSWNQVRALGGLANVSRALADHASALKRWRQVLELARERYPAGDSRFAVPLLGIGSAYAELGEYERAESYAEQALAALSGSDEHVLSIATVWANLGEIRRELGNVQGAIEAMRTSLEIFERALGPQTRPVALALRRLGTALRSAGRHADALQYEHRALVTLEAVSPGDRELVRTLHEIGKTAAAQGDLTYADKYLHDALERESVLDPRFPAGRADVLATLAEISVDQGDRWLARKHYEEALALLERESTAPATLRLRVLRMFIENCAAQGDLARARELARAADEIRDSNPASAVVRREIEAVDAALGR